MDPPDFLGMLNVLDDPPKSYAQKIEEKSYAQEVKEKGYIPRTKRAREEPEKCPHDKKILYCIDCNPDPKRFCLEHRVQKVFCKECGGSQICPCKKIRSRCKTCKGKDICPHDREITNCRQCKEERR